MFVLIGGGGDDMDIVPDAGTCVGGDDVAPSDGDNEDEEDVSGGEVERILCVFICIVSMFVHCMCFPERDT